MEQTMETRPSVPQNGGNGPPTVETGVLLIGRGVAYRRTEETDLLRSKQGSCSSGGVWRTAKRRKRTSYGRNGGPVDREGCGIPQNGRNGPPTVETGVLFIGRGVAYRKTEETDLCWSATVETGVLFIGRGVAYRKTGLHGILFISTVDLLQPPRAIVDLLQPPRVPVHPASTARYSTGYCPTTPPPSIVHPALHTTGSCSTTPP